MGGRPSLKALLHRMITFIEKCRLQFYPFILLLSAFATGTLGYAFIECLLFKVSSLGFAFYLLVLAIQLGSTYPLKLRSLQILIKKNRQSIQEESFEDYMKAPCGRQVVKIALRKIGRDNVYERLKQKYPSLVFSFGKSKTKIIFYTVREGGS